MRFSLKSEDAEDSSIRILGWYRKNKRVLSWRKNKTPYKVLVSEFLLHKTDATKVSVVYPLFVKRFPCVNDLNKADISKIRKLFSNIGLFYRADRLKKVSNQIVEEFNGEVPNSREGLLSLYGVGDYIANAVLCFGYKKRVAIVDTNIIRIYGRIFGVKSNTSRPHTDKKLWEFAEEMLPKNNYIEYNYALLDFASDICKTKSPKCKICPIITICKEYKEKS